MNMTQKNYSKQATCVDYNDIFKIKYFYRELFSRKVKVNAPF